MQTTMQAALLVRKGNANKAFEIREVPVPALPDHFVMIEVEAFGLNYADVMAREGQYQDAPPFPAILGYDVVGRIVATGSKVTRFTPGTRVTALTRFGGYAQYAVTDERAVIPIAEDMEITAALALATQGATAWYCAEEATTIYPGERVLITAAAGGVGSLLVQLAKRRGAKVYGIVSSPERAAIAQSLGADVALNRRTGDVFRQFREQEGKKSIDIMYDSAGGSYVRKAMSQLAPGGRTLCYGGAQATHARTIFSLLPFALSFGLYHPVPFLMQSQSLIGVNMLRIADHKPDVLQVCLSNIMETYRNGQIKPLPGKTYPVTQLGNAHQALEQGQVPGKIAVRW